MAIDQISPSIINNGFYSFPNTVQGNVTASISIPASALCNAYESESISIAYFVCHIISYLIYLAHRLSLSALCGQFYSRQLSSAPHRQVPEHSVDWCECHLCMSVNSGSNERVASSLLSSQIIRPGGKRVAENVVTYNNTMGRPVELTFHTDMVSYPMIMCG